MHVSPGGQCGPIVLHAGWLAVVCVVWCAASVAVGSFVSEAGLIETDGSLRVAGGALERADAQPRGSSRSVVASFTRRSIGATPRGRKHVGALAAWGRGPLASDALEGREAQ